MDASTRAALDLDARAKALSFSLGRTPNAQPAAIIEAAEKFLTFLEGGGPRQPVRVWEDTQMVWEAGFLQRAEAFFGTELVETVEHRLIEVNMLRGLFGWRAGAVYGVGYLEGVLVGTETPNADLYFEIRRRIDGASRTERAPDDPAGLAI
jgi:hypothetical protein